MCSTISLNSFKLKNCLFRVTTIVKSIIKKKRKSRSYYGIEFDGAGSWNFGNDIPKNIMFFSVDNSSSSDDEDCKNNFLGLVEDPTYGINGSFGFTNKKFSISFSKSSTKLYCSGDYSYLLFVC